MNRKEKLDIHVAEQRFSARFKLPLTKRQRLQKNKSITMKVKKGITASDEVHTILARIERLADVQTMKDTDNVDKKDFNRPQKQWKSHQKTHKYHRSVASAMVSKFINENMPNAISKKEIGTFTPKQFKTIIKGSGVSPFVLWELINRGVIKV